MKNDKKQKAENPVELKKYVTIKIDRELYEQIKKIADKEGFRYSRLIEKLLNESLDKNSYLT